MHPNPSLTLMMLAQNLSMMVSSPSLIHDIFLLRAPFLYQREDENKGIKCDCLSSKQTNHLGKISSDLLLWSLLHCLCESFDKQAVGKRRNRLWNFPAVSSESILHQLVIGKPSLSAAACRTGSYRPSPAQTARTQRPGLHPTMQGQQQIELHS